MKASMSRCRVRRGGRMERNPGLELQSCFLCVKTVYLAVIFSRWKILGLNSQPFHCDMPFITIVLAGWEVEETNNETLPICNVLILMVT